MNENPMQQTTVSDETIKPLRLKVKICNNRLIRLREALGHRSASAAARAIGVAISDYCAFEAMSRSPVNAAGQWTLQATRIAVFHRVTEDFLWPDIALAVRKTSIAMELDAAEAVAMLGESVMVPEDHVFEQQDKDRLLEEVKSLPDRIREVIELRYGLTGEEPMTLGEVAEKMGVSARRAGLGAELSKETIRQLEAKGFRTLRERFHNGRTFTEHTMDAADDDAQKIAVAVREEAFGVDPSDTAQGRYERAYGAPARRKFLKSARERA